MEQHPSGDGLQPGIHVPLNGRTCCVEQFTTISAVAFLVNPSFAGSTCFPHCVLLSPLPHGGKVNSKIGKI